MTNNPTTYTDIEEANECAGLELSLFIHHLMSLDSRLTLTEATLAAAGIIHALPQLLANNPHVMEYVRAGFEKMIGDRQ